MLRRLNPSEHQIQCAIAEWAKNTNTRYGKNKIGDFLLAIPNGGNRSITEALRLKKEGVKSGVSDLFLCIPVINNYEDHSHGLWIEVKSKKGRLSKEQIEWMDLMKSQHYEAVVVKSVDEGIDAIKCYLGVR